MIIRLPQEVAEIIEQLEKSGYEAYAVGGCVRDSLMGKIPHDWDITTSALPQQVLSSLGKENIIDSGLKHGTVTVKYNSKLYEITTFRTDGNYTDHRRPESVTFVSSLYDDLSRRDFTMNSIAYNRSAGFEDPFSGADDIRSGLIRCVGDPDRRFDEDALRILRALRFASRFGFEIEEKTAESVHKNAGLLTSISAERICSELLQIIDGSHAGRVLMEYSDVIAVVIPEIRSMIGLSQCNPHHIYDVWEHTVKVVENSPHGRVSRLAALLHDIGKPECFTLDNTGTGHFHGHPKISSIMSRDILHRLKLDNKTISTVLQLIEYHDTRPPAEPKSVRRLLSKFGTEHFRELLDLKRADIMGQNPAMISEKLAYVNELERVFKEQTAGGNEYNLRTLSVNGSDLMTIGIKDGREIGKMLRYLLSAVIDGRAENDRDELLKLAKECSDNEL